MKPTGKGREAFSLVRCLSVLPLFFEAGANMPRYADSHHILAPRCVSVTHGTYTWLVHTMMAVNWNANNVPVDSARSSSSVSSCGHYREVCVPPADAAPVQEPRRKISLTQLPYIAKPHSEKDVRCGWWRFRPDFLLNFRHPRSVHFLTPPPLPTPMSHFLILRMSLLCRLIL